MLKVTNLRKEYDTVVAVDNISLEAQRGEVFGLLGPNGAGKTTTIRTVLNIIEPDSGEITFDGKPFTQEMWNIIGYLPEERGLYRKSKIINTILYFASLKNLPINDAKQQAYYWLERFGLKNEGHRKIEELSKGNQQKIQLIISLIHQPQLLILDEPFSGLDPVNQVLLKDILLELRKNNVAIIFSTHQMEQVEKMCDNICLINKGRQVLGGTLTDIKKHYGSNSVRLEYDGNGDFLKHLPIVRTANIYQNYAELELTDVARSEELLTAVNGRLSLRKFEIVEPSLNSIFIHVVGGAEKLELAGEKPIPPVVKSKNHAAHGVYHDSRVRRRIFSLSAAVLLGALFGTWKLVVEHTIDQNVVLLIAVIVLVTVVQFVRTKNIVEKELRSKEAEARQ